MEAANGEQKGCYTLASVCCLTLSYTFFFFLFLLSCSSLKSSSAPLSANVKNSTLQRGNSRWCPLLFLLAGSIFCVWHFSALTVFFLYTEIQSQHWLWCKNEKMFLKIQSGWLDAIFFVDEGVTLCFSVATELNSTHFCEGSVFFFHYCHLFLI